jgi:hypothetical protein
MILLQSRDGWRPDARLRVAPDDEPAPLPARARAWAARPGNPRPGRGAETPPRPDAGGSRLRRPRAPAPPRMCVMENGLRERVSCVLLAQRRLQLLVEPPRGLHRRHEHVMALWIEQDPLQLLDVRLNEVEQHLSALRPDVAFRRGHGCLVAPDQLGDDRRIDLDRSWRPAKQWPGGPRPGAAGRSRQVSADTGSEFGFASQDRRQDDLSNLHRSSITTTGTAAGGASRLPGCLPSWQSPLVRLLDPVTSDYAGSHAVHGHEEVPAGGQVEGPVRP